MKVPHVPPKIRNSAHNSGARDPKQVRATDVSRKTRRDAIVDFAKEFAGTAIDIDHQLEDAGIGLFRKPLAVESQINCLALHSVGNFFGSKKRRPIRRLKYGKTIAKNNWRPRPHTQS